MRWLLVLLVSGACLAILVGGCSGATDAAQEMLDLVGAGGAARADTATPVPALPTATPTITSTPTATPVPPTPTPTATATPTPKPLAVLAKGFGQNLGPASYGFVVENPNPALAVENSLYQVALYDDKGTVLRTDTGSIGLLQPGEKLGMAGEVGMFKQDPKVTRVEVQVQAGTFVIAKPVAPLTVDKVSYRHDIWLPRVTGVVKSPYAKAIDRVRVSALLFDANGGIIGGGTGYVRFIPANGEAAVQLNVITAARPQSVELYPMIGALSQLQ